MEQFIARYRPFLTSVLSGFDRLVFRGTMLPRVIQGGMFTFLTRAGVQLLDFKSMSFRSASGSRRPRCVRPLSRCDPCATSNLRLWTRRPWPDNCWPSTRWNRD